jgi:hypothetical protein
MTVAKPVLTGSENTSENTASAFLDTHYFHGQLECDRGNPGVKILNPYPYPFKTPTLDEGRGFEGVGVGVENFYPRVTPVTLYPRVFLHRHLHRRP